MQLTRLLIVATTLLAALGGAMLGRILWGEWNHYTAVSDGLHTLQLVQGAMTAAEKLSLERGPVNGVLGDPRIGKILMKARFAVELREYAGRLGSRLTVALAAQQPLSATEHAQLQFLRGQVEQLRRLLELPATTVDDDPRVQAALRAMNQHYFGRGLALIDGIEQASRAGRPYGLDTSQLALRYVPLMAPILQLRDALLQAALDQATRDFDAARRELWLACLTGLMILLALTLLVLIVRRRVVLPQLRGELAPPTYRGANSWSTAACVSGW